jgi:hypothetical protein
MSMNQKETEIYLKYNYIDYYFLTLLGSTDFTMYGQISSEISVNFTKMTCFQFLKKRYAKKFEIMYYKLCLFLSLCATNYSLEKV